MEDNVVGLFNESNIINSYLKQFVKYLDGKNILSFKNNIYNNYLRLEEMGFKVDEYKESDIPKLIDEKLLFDGVLLFLTTNNLLNNDNKEFFSSLSNILAGDAYIMIVIKKRDENIVFNKEYIDIISAPYFSFIEELSSYDDWKFYIYKKNTIK